MTCPFTIIGIGGASCSGKTSSSRSLVEMMGRSPEIAVDLICMDDYYWDVNDSRHVKHPVTGYIDYDCLSSVDWDRMMADVRAWRDRRSDLSISHRILLIEGAFVLEYKELVDMMDICLFLSLNYQTMSDRRRLRTYDPPDPPAYFETHVWPSFQRSLTAVQQVDKIVQLDVSNFQWYEQLHHIWKHLKAQLPTTPIPPSVPQQPPP